MSALAAYVALKWVHVLCVVLSGAGFVLRGVWMLRASPLLARRVVRIAPHGVDSVLLASAIALVALSGQYPWSVAWVGAKVGGLLLYIALGMVALRRGATRRVRAGAFCAALAVFAWIVSVALTRHPAGFLVAVSG